MEEHKNDRSASKLLDKFKLEQFPEPEYLPVDRPVLLCHGYGALASLLKKKSPLYEVCMFLRSHGVLCFAPNVVPYARIETRAKSWVEIVDTICRKTGNSKLHIIAHSMGGLDIRYACKNFDLCPRVASITTLATPHKGASLADFTLEAPEMVKKNITAFTDWIANYIYPEEKSDTRGALYQLSTRYINDYFNLENGIQPDVPCFSYSAAVGKGTDVPISKLLKYQNRIIYEREGLNDGFVSVKSAKWAEHIDTIALSHLEQIKINISNSKISLWKAFWINLIRTLSEKIRK